MFSREFFYRKALHMGIGASTGFVQVIHHWSATFSTGCIEQFELQGTGFLSPSTCTKAAWMGRSSTGCAYTLDDQAVERGRYGLRGAILGGELASLLKGALRHIVETGIVSLAQVQQLADFSQREAARLHFVERSGITDCRWQRSQY